MYAQLVLPPRSTQQPRAAAWAMSGEWPCSIAVSPPLPASSKAVLISKYPTLSLLAVAHTLARPAWFM